MLGTSQILLYILPHLETLQQRPAIVHQALIPQQPLVATALTMDQSHHLKHLQVLSHPQHPIVHLAFMDHHKNYICLCLTLVKYKLR